MVRVLSTLETDNKNKKTIEAKDVLRVMHVDKDLDIAVNSKKTSWTINQWILKGKHNKLDVHKPIRLDVEVGDMVEILETNHIVTMKIIKHCYVVVYCNSEIIILHALQFQSSVFFSRFSISRLVVRV